jgi:hypothetical protein
MPLWGNKDYQTGNNKPLYANTTNATSSSVIHGTAANTNAYYGIVAGVSPTELDATLSAANHPQHAGWNSIKIGTGPITGITITGGTGINASGFLRIADASAHGQGTGANISYTTANSQNTLQTFSSNSTLNTFGTFTVVSGGAGFSNSAAITLGPTSTSISNGTITAVLGGRAGRFRSETLVAMGSITFDDPRDNVWFSGI